jgi:hypothetical protein
MSRKKLRLDRRIEVLSGDPAHLVSLPLKTFGLLSSRKLSLLLVARLECARRGKQEMLTMVLSEARGLSLFLVIRGGIACNG